MNLEEFVKKNKSVFDDQKVSSNFDTHFAETLTSELHQPKKNNKVIYLQIMAVAACLAVIFTIVFWQNNTNFSPQKKEILANLNNESAGKRLEAVYNFSDDYKKEDEKIIASLLNLLHKDDNANVKIATIEALLKFPQNETIRISLIEALSTETEPLVQIKLIKALSFLRENRAQKPLKKIINNSQTFPIVKNNATLAMAQIKK